MTDLMTLPDLLSYDDLGAQGLSRHGLDRLTESGEFERIAPGPFPRWGMTPGMAREIAQQQLGRDPEKPHGRRDAARQWRDVSRSPGDEGSHA